MGRPSIAIPVLPNLSSPLSRMDQRWCARFGARSTLGGPDRERRLKKRGVVHRRNLRSGKKGGACVGKSRAGQTTKIMALANSDGLPLSIAIDGGNRHDIVLTDRTLDAAFVDELPQKLIADKAWDSAKLQARLLEERNIELISPKRGGQRPSKRKQDGRALRRYKRRWKVERLFAWLKRFRRIGTRWESKSENYLGFLHLGCMMLLLRRF